MTQVSPYIDMGMEMASPIIASSGLLFGVCKASAGAGMAGVSTAMKVAVNTMKEDIDKRGYNAKRQSG